MTRTGAILLVIIAAMLAWAHAAQAGYVRILWDAPTQDIAGVSMEAKDIWMYRLYKKTATSWSTVTYTSGYVTECIVVQTDGTTNQYAVSAIGRSGLESGKSTNVFIVYTPTIPTMPASLTGTNWNLR